MARRPVTWLAALVFLAAAFSTGAGIKCYQCKNAASNDDCTGEENLHDCSDPYNKYDVCQTIVFNRGMENMRITKKCAVGPCSLGKDQTTALNLGCSGNQCIECCQTDACNYSGAPAPPPALPAVARALGAALFCVLVVQGVLVV